MSYLLECEVKASLITYRFEFTITRPMVIYKGYGKAWPKHIWCNLFINDESKHIGRAVKHIDEADNNMYGIVVAARKCISNIPDKNTRYYLWKAIFREARKKGYSFTSSKPLV